MPRILKIMIMIATTVGLGYIAGQITQTSVTTWYPTLAKPVFTPPNWAFPVAWGLLYFLMGIAGGLVWGQINVDEANVKKALKFFAIQFALNMAWSFIFFGMCNPLLAFFEIIILWLMIYETYVLFAKVHKAASYLFIPYIIWVSYALVLNGSIWWMNR
ncbi:MAG: TspO/MBR family protein [Bacteroidota bacterium]